MNLLLFVLLLLVLFGGGGYSWHAYNANPQSGGLLGLLVLVCVVVLLLRLIRGNGPPVV